MKNTYNKVIQQNWNGTWEDVSDYETKSDFTFKTKEERKIFLSDLNEYRMQTSSTRTIKRRSKVEDNNLVVA